MISASIIIDSTNSSVGSNKSHLKTKFINPIELNPSRKHSIKLISSKIPLTKYNISSTLSNNSIRYSTNAGVGWNVITFTNGIYELSTIEATIKYNLVNNSHYQTNASTGENEYPFNVGGNSATSRGFFTINSSYTTSAYTDIIIDISNNSTSTLYALLGFAATSTTLSATSAIEFISDSNINIYDGQFNLRLVNLISSFSNNQSSDILYKGTFNGTLNGYYFLPNSDVKEIEGLIKDGINKIYELEIRLEDRNGNLIALSDDSTDSDVYFQFFIY